MNKPQARQKWYKNGWAWYFIIAYIGSTIFGICMIIDINNQPVYDRWIEGECPQTIYKFNNKTTNFEYKVKDYPKICEIHEVSLDKDIGYALAIGEIIFMPLLILFFYAIIRGQGDNNYYD